MDVATDAAIGLLQRAGMVVRIDSVDELVLDGIPVEMKARMRPTPSDLRRELSRWRKRASAGKLAYVVPRATASLVSVAMEEPTVILIGVDDATLVNDGTVFRFQGSLVAQPGAAPARVAWGRFALIRSLLRTPEPRTQRQLAGESGITQAAVSKGLREIGDVADAARQGVRPAAEQLWSRFLDEYPGARGIRSHWYSLDPPVRQAEAVQRAFPGVLVSGDTGADRIAPWRVVTGARVYSRIGLDLASLGFAEAASDDATLTLVVPADPTIWSTAAAWAEHRRVPDGTADPLIVAHDVMNSGGSDVADAVDRIRGQLFEAWSR
ncbi:hypothetical protein [Agromyces sp. NPDC056965]|uniref:hypothetical protein n=1 Tax=Agromyces sp. NPDC056965 TaxID=3345983 RepID=UPI00363AD866